MRNQKQSNKAPRPFKNKNSSRGWSGGNEGFIPAPKIVQRAVKKVSPSPAGEGSAAQASE